MNTLHEEIKNLNQWDYYDRNSSSDIRDWNNDSEHKDFIKEFLDSGGKQSIIDSFFNEDLQRAGVSLDNFERATHTNSVFFIGCLLYEKLGLNEKIEFIREDGKGDEFHFIWFLTSLVHDFGYFAENDKSKFPHITENVSSLNLTHDLLKYRNESEDDSSDYLKKAYDKYQESTKKIIDYIPKYFKEAFQGKKSSNGKFKIEHGIYSGLVLYDALVKNRLEKKDNQLNNQGLYWKDDLDKFYGIASFAIAIHNMRRTGIVEDSSNLKFSIQNEPYLFLFALADTIEPTKIFECVDVDVEYILENILINMNENTIILENAPDSKLDFSKLISRISGLESWLDLKITKEENKVTVELLTNN